METCHTTWQRKTGAKRRVIPSLHTVRGRSPPTEGQSKSEDGCQTRFAQTLAGRELPVAPEEIGRSRSLGPLATVFPAAAL